MADFFNLCFRFFPDEIGGSKRYIHDLNKYLVKNNHTSTVITGMPANKNLPETEIIDGINVKRYNVSTKKNIKSFFNNIIQIKNIISKIRFNKFDYYFFHHSFPALMLLLFVHPIINKKIYFFFYGPWSKEFLLDQKYKNIKKNKFFKIISYFKNLIFTGLFWCSEKYVLSKSDKVIVLSEYSKKLCTDFYRINPDKIIKFKGGVDSELFTKPYKKRINKEKITLLTIRRLESRMGIDNLIKAVYLLNKKGFEKKIKLLIGGKGRLKNYYIELIKKFNVGNIEFLGFIPDEKLSEIYNNSDFFVLPTLSEEGFGLVTIESLLNGTIVIGTDVGATPEILKQISDELIINGNNPEKIADKIEYIISLPGDKLDFLKSKAYRIVKEKYLWEKIIKEFLIIIKK